MVPQLISLQFATPPGLPASLHTVLVYPKPLSVSQALLRLSMCQTLHFIYNILL